MLCVYCAKDKHISEMSKEHVIPRKLGGNLEPQNPFLLQNVCKQCNSATGRYVDGSFIKNWFMQNKRASHALKYVDLSNSPIIPLTYMGEIEEELLIDKICDFWLGPTGDTIYHFHNPYPKCNFIEPTIGPPLSLRDEQYDPGFVFIFVRATNPMWHPCILLSIDENFSDSVLYLGNGPTVPGGRFSDIPQEFKSLHSKLKSMAGTMHKCKFAMGIDWGDRFLAKVALGCGVLFLDSDYSTSPDADLLRRFMWECQPKERKKICLSGNSFLAQDLKPLCNLLDWSAGHSLLLFPLRGKLLLIIVIYGELAAGIQMCSKPALWQKRIDQEGSLFIIAPGLRQFAGPISLPNYIDFKLNGTISTSIIPLTNMLSRIKAIEKIPPFD